MGHWRDLPFGFGATLQAEAVNFQRSLGPDGARVDVEPARGLASGAERHLPGRLAAAWRYTTYALQDTPAGTDDTLNRFVPTLSLDSGWCWSAMRGRKEQRLHTLEPRLLYLYVPYRNQDQIPVFDTGLPDPEHVAALPHQPLRRPGPRRRREPAERRRHQPVARLARWPAVPERELGQAFYFESPRVRLPDEPVTDRSTSDVICGTGNGGISRTGITTGLPVEPRQSRTEKSEMAVAVPTLGWDA